MGRQLIRELSRAVRASAQPGAGAASITLARDGALALLERSILFGHGRLAVIRLVTAVRCGARVSTTQWDYCRGVAHASRDERLRALFREALEQLSSLEEHRDG